MSDDSVIYQFKSAAKHQGRDITEIEVRARLVKHLRGTGYLPQPVDPGGRP